MIHPLAGTKQTPEHIAKRVASFKRTISIHPKKLGDIRKNLLSKIIKKDSGCWEWTGSIFKNQYGSYGQIRMGRRCANRVLRAHRVSYEYFVGKIPDGLELDHLCHNTLCINPEHLEPVTHIENCRRRKDSGLPYCRHGHKYTLETTYIRPDNGRRECMMCRKIRAENYKQAIF
jgi:hypothetical protein